jgi:hypothetical protein
MHSAAPCRLHKAKSGLRVAVQAARKANIAPGAPLSLTINALQTRLRRTAACSTMISFVLLQEVDLQILPQGGPPGDKRQMSAGKHARTHLWRKMHYGSSVLLPQREAVVKKFQSANLAIAIAITALTAFMAAVFALEAQQGATAGIPLQHPGLPQLGSNLLAAQVSIAQAKGASQTGQRLRSRNEGSVIEIICEGGTVVENQWIPCECPPGHTAEGGPVHYQCVARLKLAPGGSGVPEGPSQ